MTAASRINVLPQEVSNKIAAGEVVERPASVVKELIENSLDAGSSKIEIEVENAGRKLIKVSDDGEGITSEDLKLTTLRHATSKIREASDLNNINTLGFRGEALASIAAVSQLRISSRSPAESTGWVIEVEGGKLKKKSETARTKGTTVEMRSLFFNTPARLKFLKSPATEMFHIIRTVTEFALSFSRVSFKLVSNGTQIINLAANNSLLERISILLGQELADNLLGVSCEMPALKVSGFSAKAGFGQSNRNNQYIFVNRRPVKDKIIYHAISQAYHTFLPEKQFPPAVLFIEISAQSVDVNVHPAKLQIKFRNSAFVHDVLVKAVREAITDKEYLPEIEMSAADKYKPDGRGASLYKHDVRKEQLSDKRAFEEKVANSQWALFSDKDNSAPSLFKQESTSDSETGQIPHYIQLKDTYIVFSEKDGMVIIDQHAAHERVLFDELLLRFKKKDIEKQKLLLPITLTLNRAERALLSDYKDLFEKIGFDIDDFGKDTFVVQSYPVILGKIDIRAMFEGVLTEIARLEISADMEEKITQFLAPIACHSAVRAGDKLSPVQIKSILQRLWNTSAPYTCPHGRPTMIKMSWDELKKKFRRK